MRFPLAPLSIALAAALSAGCTPKMVRPPEPRVETPVVGTAAMLDCVDQAITASDVNINFMVGNVENLAGTSPGVKLPEDLAEFVSLAFARISANGIQLFDAQETTGIGIIPPPGVATDPGLTRHFMTRAAVEQSGYPLDLVISGALLQAEEVDSAVIDVDLLGLGGAHRVKGYDVTLSLRALEANSRKIVGGPISQSERVLFQEVGASLWVAVGDNLVSAKRTVSTRTPATYAVLKMTHMAVAELLSSVLNLNTAHCYGGAREPALNRPRTTSLQLRHSPGSLCVEIQPGEPLHNPMLSVSLLKSNRRIMEQQVKLPLPPMQQGKREYACVDYAHWPNNQTHWIEVLLYENTDTIASEFFAY